MSVCCIWCRDNSKFKLRMYHAFSNKLRKKGLKATLMWSQLLHTCTETVDITGFWVFLQIFSNSVRLDYEALHWSLIEFILHFILPPKDTRTQSRLRLISYFVLIAWCHFELLPGYSELLPWMPGRFHIYDQCLSCAVSECGHTSSTEESVSIFATL